MKKTAYIFLSSILSGFFITIGGTVYLSMLDGGKGEYMAKILGSLFFGLGLFTIITFATWLYTGKVGFVLDNKPKYFLDLLICVLGNFAGVFSLSKLISFTRYGDMLYNQAIKLVEQKQADTWYSILILSFMCGIMIYIAVKGHMVCSYPVGKALICFLAVAVFILCGFEHVIANAVYYTYAKYFDLKALVYFMIMTIGNGLGSISIDGLLKLQTKLKD